MDWIECNLPWKIDFYQLPIDIFRKLNEDRKNFKFKDIDDVRKKEYELMKQNGFDSFCGRGLNKPGTLIVIDGKEYLIGDVTKTGIEDSCECCTTGINDQDIVEKYKIII